MDIFGTVLVFLGLGLGIYAVLTTGAVFFPDTNWGQLCFLLIPHGLALRLRHNVAAAGIAEVPTRGYASTPEERSLAETVRSSSRGEFLQIDGRQEHIKASAVFEELQSFGGDKNDKRHVDPNTGNTLREFRAFLLAGDQLLIEQPSGEGKSTGFFMYKDRSEDIPTGFTEYLKGKPGNPGPAKEFADSDQRATVTMEVLGSEWTLTDIQWMDVDVQSGEFFVRGKSGSKPRLAMVLAESEGEWLLFADLRSGQGSDTLWVGSKLDLKASLEI